MAERRMFAKTIIDSDAFLDMPISARLLYYDLAMRADDDGFVNSPKKIMKFVGATSDDLGILVMRKFIIPFDCGVVVIKHWRIHNYIRKDTYNETKYKEQMDALELDENNSYRLKSESSLLSVNDPSTNRQLPVDTGKVRLGKDNITDTKVSVVSSERKKESYPDDFEQLWSIYPNKSSGKKSAFKSFQKAITECSIGDMLNAVYKQQGSEQWTKENGKYIPMLTTWLNQGRWSAVLSDIKQGGGFKQRPPEDINNKVDYLEL